MKQLNFLLAVSIFFVAASFSHATAKCPSEISEDYIFATKAPLGSEDDKSPTRVGHSGGYVLEEALDCTTGSVSIKFNGAHYAQDSGAGTVRVEFYSQNNDKIKEKNFRIRNQMKNWQDLYDNSKMKEYSAEISFGEEKQISKIKIFAIPGNWAVIISDLNIHFNTTEK